MSSYLTRPKLPHAYLVVVFLTQFTTADWRAQSPPLSSVRSEFREDVLNPPARLWACGGEVYRYVSFRDSAAAGIFSRPRHHDWAGGSRKRGQLRTSLEYVAIAPMKRLLAPYGKSGLVPMSPGIPRDRGLFWLDGYIPFPIKSTLFGRCFSLTTGSGTTKAAALI